MYIAVPHKFLFIVASVVVQRDLLRAILLEAFQVLVRLRKQFFTAAICVCMNIQID